MNMRMPGPDICAWIRSKYRYEASTGKIFFISGRCAGQEPMVNVNEDGYERVALKNTKLGISSYVLVHRLAWFLHYGEFPASQVDHEDRVRTNHRIANLRLATPGQNRGNTEKQSHNRGRLCTSVYKGVYWIQRTQKWKVTISHDGSSIHLGVFDSEIEAAMAYNTAARATFGEFACLNEGLPF